MRQHITASISKLAFDWVSWNCKKGGIKFSAALDAIILAQKNTAPRVRRELLKEELHSIVHELTGPGNDMSMDTIHSLCLAAASFKSIVEAE